MEIKVKCVCGSVYSFEEVPVNGRLAFTIFCADCGADGTAGANNYIERKLAGEFDLTRKPKGGLGLFRFRRKKNEFENVEKAKPAVATDKSVGQPRRIKLALALVGAVAVGAVGAWGWLQLAKATGVGFGFAGWAIGGLVGCASRLFAPRGHYWLGSTAALAAFLSIGGGQVFVTKWLVDKEVQKALVLAYDETREYAKEVVETESDDELRECLAKYRISLKDGGVRNPHAGFSRDGRLFQLGWRLYGIMDRETGATSALKELIEASDPKRIGSEDLAFFKSNDVPNLKTFLAGKPSRNEYEATLRKMIHSRISFKNLVTQLIRPYSLLWLTLGLGTAYKLARSTSLGY
jgi:hypothetical protein